MSDVMLLGVLCMPPELWQDTELDKAQRHSRYLEASRRIRSDELEILRLNSELADAVKSIDLLHEQRRSLEAEAERLRNALEPQVTTNG